MELTIELSLLTQQLRMRQMANEYHQRERSQVWNPHMSMDHVRYGGTLYLNSNNVGWGHHLSTSWEERQDTFHFPHVQRLSLEETMAELAKARAEMANSRLEQNMAEMKRSQVELDMVQAAFSRSMANRDYS